MGTHIFLISAAFVLLLTALVRALPGYLDPNRYESDEAYHLYLTDEIRRNGHRVPEKHPRIRPITKVNYPALMHLLLSYLPARVVHSISPYVGAIVDTVHNAVVMAFAYWMFTSTGLGGAVPATQGTVLSGLVFALTPRLVTGRHISSRLRFSSRAFGSLFFTGTLILFTLYHMTDDIGFLLLSTIPFGVILLSSYYSTQTLCLLVGGLAVLTADWLLLLTVPAATALATVVSRGRYVGIFRSHVGSLWFYFVELETARVRYWMRKFSHALKLLLGKKPVGSVWPSVSKRKVSSLYSHDIINFYAQSPYLLLTALVFASPIEGPIVDFCLYWIGTLLVANLVVSIPGVTGKPAHRFAEYIVFPVSTLSAVAVYATGPISTSPLGSIGTLTVPTVLILSLVGLYSICVIAVNIYLEIRIGPGPGLPDALDWLSERSEQGNVIGIPGHYAKRTLPDTDHNVFMPVQDTWATKAGRRETSELFVGTRPLDELNRRYGLDYVLLGKTSGEAAFPEEELANMNHVFSSGDVDVYEYDGNHSSMA